MLHGGYFADEYDRSVNMALARRLAHEGSFVANVEYRRTGSSDSASQTVDDVRAAITHVVGRCPGADRVVVLGHSAGGYLCIAAATVPGVTSVLSLAPVTALRETADGGWDEGAIARWIGSACGDDPDAWDRMELGSASLGGVPCTIVHGSEDHVVPIEHSVRFVAQAGTPARDVFLVRLPDVGHYEFLDSQSSATAAVLKVLGLN